MTSVSTLNKKTVLHQQLYGSKRCVRTPARHEYPVDSLHEIPVPEYRVPFQNQHSHCLLHQSQSSSGLNRLKPCESCATIPSTVLCGTDNTNNWHINPNECSCPNNIYRKTVPQCTCRNSTFNLKPENQQRYHNLSLLSHPLTRPNQKTCANGYYFGYENTSHITDDDSAFPGLPERELNLLHCNVPALRRTGVDTTGMRQYFYPDGGWGWIICGLAFLAHLLTTGLQLSYGILMIFIIQHLHKSNVSTEWLGALNWSVSMLAVPFVVALCRKKSTRLLAVVGGLMLPLGILFTSFATEIEQVVFSYGFLFGIGVAIVRDSSAMMIGNYFKRRRNFVEMIAMSGEGIGIALFSVLLKEGVGKAGWRLGLQIIAAFLSVSFFMALLYRPASLYHPQRRAIQHLKNQRKRMRDDKTTSSIDTQAKNKFFLLDVSSLKSANVKILVMTSGVAALGIYAPMFTISLSAEKEESDIQDLVLLQTFLGISTTLGVVLASALVRHPFRIGRFVVTSQVISQVFISAIAIAILFLSFVMGYQGLCILSWIYGIGFGGFRYSIKILALERIKIKQFSKAWGFIKGIESVPVLVSVPLTTFLNDYSLKYGRAGYYICSAAAAIAGIIIFFINHSNLLQQGSNFTALSNRRYENGFIPSLFPPTAPTKFSTRFNNFYNYNEADCDYAIYGLSRSCISLNNADFRNYNQISSPVCCRLQVQCFRNMPSSGTIHPFERNSRRRRTIETEVRRLQPSKQQHICGHGSIGSRTGREIQSKLSYMQNFNYCDPQLEGTCHRRINNACSCIQRSTNLEASGLICTCNLPLHCRSLSVPEGLSTISQHCNCKAPLLPLNTFDSVSVRLPEENFEHRINRAYRGTPHRSFSATPRNCQLQRSESLTKPLHYVEQMTTSV